MKCSKRLVFLVIATCFLTGTSSARGDERGIDKDFLETLQGKPNDVEDTRRLQDSREDEDPFMLSLTREVDVDDLRLGRSRGRDFEDDLEEFIDDRQEFRSDSRDDDDL